MNLPQAAVSRPIFTSMITLLVLILGGVALSHVSIDLLPEIERPSISITTRQTDSSPQEIEEAITRPLEQNLSAVSGVKEIRSTSSEGASSISMDFVWGTDLDAATNDVRDRIDRSMRGLPDDIDRPQVRKFDSAAMPVLMMGFSSNRDLLTARKFVEDDLGYRFERLPGVASMQVGGGVERQIKVELDMDRIKALQIPFNQLMDRIRRGNINTPGGNIEEGHREVRVRIPGTYTSIAELGDTVVSQITGSPVHLRDIAQITDGAADRNSLNRINSQDGVRVLVYKQSGDNTVSVSDATLAEMENINSELAEGKFVLLFDTAEYIRQSLSSVSMTALGGGILAVLVLLFFLRNIRSTMVVAATIPVSVVACFTLLYFSGYSLNIMTLGGLALGIGMLVDNSIVVLENIIQKWDSGLNRKNAAVMGAAEVASAILASTLTTAVVFLPLLFIAGMAGLLFKQLAHVVVFSLFCSLIASLTLVPMLASRWLTRSKTENSNFLSSLIQKFLAEIETSYFQILKASLLRKKTVLLVIFLLFISSLFLIPYVGTELMPNTDESEVRVNFEMESGTRLELVEVKVKEVEDLIIKQVPELRVLQVSAGDSGRRASSSHRGSFRIKLIPASERQRSSQEIALDLDKKLTKIAGIKSRCRVRSSILGRIVGGSGNNTVDIDVRGHNLDTASMLAAEIVRRGELIAGVTDAEISRSEGVPERNIQIDRKKAADLGLSVQDVSDALRTVISGQVAGRFKIDGQEYDILMRVKGADRMAINDILDLTITNRQQQSVILRNILQENLGTGPSAIERKDRERITTVSINAPDRPLGDVVSELKAAMADLPIPQGFTLAFTGSYEEQQRSFKELFFSLILALVLVYIVMACQFESLRDPLIVMFSVPLAAVGVIVVLLLTNTTFNLQSFIGCIMLSGIVVNNAILLVDQANLLREQEQMDVLSAITEAGRRRLRPILMTATTTCLGLLPLALGIGDGGEAQAPMARAVIGGLISSTLITLIIIPIIYSFTKKDTTIEEVS